MKKKKMIASENTRKLLEAHEWQLEEFIKNEKQGIGSDCVPKKKKARVMAHEINGEKLCILPLVFIFLAVCTKSFAIIN